MRRWFEVINGFPFITCDRSWNSGMQICGFVLGRAHMQADG